MIKYLFAAASVIFFVAAGSPSEADTMEIPSEKSFPSSVGEVIFHHQMHIRDLGIKCVECHHQIDAKTLTTPHPDYLKSSWINCNICHNESEKIKQKVYTCSACHHTNPTNIADETLSAKVVIHKKCWTCHQVSTGKEASKGCGKCHSGKKTL
jgi:Zn finger protein HypA/HybF involved in hydrogenase expression